MTDAVWRSVLQGSPYSTDPSTVPKDLTQDTRSSVVWRGNIADSGRDDPRSQQDRVVLGLTALLNEIPHTLHRHFKSNSMFGRSFCRLRRDVFTDDVA